MADSILRLKVESQEYDNKLKQATNGLTRYVDECRKVGGTLEVVEKETLEYVKAIGQMETHSRTATGKLAEMKKAFVEFSSVYKNMTEQEKTSPVGKALSQSLDQLNARISDSKKQLEDINRELNGSKFGQFGGMIDTLGQKMGITGNITEMLTSKTALLTGAIGAGIAIVTKSTEAWAAYNSELAKQDQITTVTTGLKGEDADRMTDKVRAMVDTYNVDFREAINAANTLMSQFGESGDSAIRLLKDGMQGMIQGDGPKLLQMIQQFAPAFRDAGVGASQLIAVIQNAEGGLFSEQNMNAILMGIKNIRLMTDSTSKALAKMGIDGQEMSRKMSDGSMTVFEALHQVATALEGAKAGSKEAGEVMQYVFGRQGAMQGMKLARAIAELNTNLEETKKQTGEVGDAFNDLQEANEKLNIAIREAFSYDGWDQMVIGIRSKLITALADVVDLLAKIRSYVSSDNNVSWDITTKPGVKNLADDSNIDDHGNYIKKTWNTGGMQVVQQTPAAVTPIYIPTKKTGGGGNTVKMPTWDDFARQNIKTNQYLDDNLDKVLAGRQMPSVWEMFNPEGMKKMLGLNETQTFDLKKDISEKDLKKLLGLGINEEFDKFYKDFSKVGSGINSIVGGIQSMGVEIPKELQDVLGILQGISTIMGGISALLSLIQIDTKTTAIATTADASMPFFARGGIVPHAAGGYEVPGTHFSGDVTPILANAGEVVLNRAQTAGLAHELEGTGGGGNGGAVQAILSGEQAYIMINRYTKRSGKGELMTWK